MKTNQLVNSPVKWEVLHGFRLCSSCCCWWWWCCPGIEWIRQLSDKTSNTTFLRSWPLPQRLCLWLSRGSSFCNYKISGEFFQNWLEALKIKSPDDLSYKGTMPCHAFRELCQHLSTNHERFFFTLSCKTERRFVTVFTRCKGIQDILGF